MKDIPSLALTAVAIAWRRRYLIVVPLLVLPPLAFGLGTTRPQTFKAQATILVQETAKLNPFLNDLSVGPNLKERMPALQSLVHSAHILEGVLEDTGAITPTDSANERAIKIRRLSSAISVQLVGNDLVAFRISGPTGQGMAATLNALSKRFVERLLAPERSSIRDSQVFLQQELDERTARLDKAQAAYAKFKSENRDRLPSLEGSLVVRLSALEQKLSDNRMQIKAAEGELGNMRQRLIGTNPVIGRIEEDILATTRKLGELATRYTDEHSAVQGEKRTLRRLEQERDALLADAESMKGADLDRLWNLAVSASGTGDNESPSLLITQMNRLQETNSSYARLKEETAALEREIEQIHTAIAETGPVMQQQKQLEEAIRIAQESYEGIAKRFDNAQITGALGEFEAPERIKIIEAPTDPVVPTTPGSILYLLGGIIAAILAGAGLAIAAEILDTRLRSRDQFEAAAGVPVIARFTA